MEHSQRPQHWLITGSSSGIGNALMQEALLRGYNVTGLARSYVANPGEYNGGAYTLRCDTRNELDVKKCIQNAIAKYKILDILICNAGISQSVIFEDTTDKIMSNVIETNFYGSVHVIREAMPIFREQGFGKIIINTSMHGLSTRPFGASYCASKHALEGLAGVLRMECGSFLQIMCLELGWFPATSIGSGIHIRPNSQYGIGNDPYAEIYKHHKNEISIAIKQIVNVIEKRKIPPRLLLGADAMAKVGDAVKSMKKTLKLSAKTAYDCSLPLNTEVQKTKIPLIRRKFMPGRVRYYIGNLPFISFTPYTEIKLRKFVKALIKRVKQ